MIHKRSPRTYKIRCGIANGSFTFQWKSVTCPKCLRYAAIVTIMELPPLEAKTVKDIDLDKLREFWKIKSLLKKTNAVKLD